MLATVLAENMIIRVHPSKFQLVRTPEPSKGDDFHGRTQRWQTYQITHQNVSFLKCVI